jgi:sodium-coupled monocarboxylate transporter 8/12
MGNYWFEWQLKVDNVAFSACLYFKIKQVLVSLVLITVLQYLELRFGQVARLAASISFSLQMILYMGIVLYAPALALEAVSGLSKALSVWTVGLVCTFYSTIGGMKAVIITDVFQVCENLLKIFYFVYFHTKKRNTFH